MFDEMIKNIHIKEKNFYKQFVSKLTIYGYLDLFSKKSVFYDTEEELLQYIDNNDTTFGQICKIEYLGNILGKNSVIRRTLKNGNVKLFIIYDEDVYGMYDYRYSLYRKDFMWDFEFGNLKEIYNAFIDRDIVDEEDLYQKIENRNNFITNKINIKK